MNLLACVSLGHVLGSVRKLFAGRGARTLFQDFVSGRFDILCESYENKSMTKSWQKLGQRLRTTRTRNRWRMRVAILGPLGSYCQRSKLNYWKWCPFCFVFNFQMRKTAFVSERSRGQAPERSAAQRGEAEPEGLLNFVQYLLYSPILPWVPFAINSTHSGT